MSFRVWWLRCIVPFILLCGSFSLSGCVFFSELIGLGPQKPKVEVTSIEVRGISLTDLDLAIGLSIENQNSFELSLRSVRYDLQANGAQLALGEFTEGLVVGAKARGEAVVPVRIRLKEAGELAKHILAGATSIKTLLSGSAIFDTPVGLWEMPFRQEKDLVSP